MIFLGSKLPDDYINVDWFLYDISNNQLISSDTLPSHISDDKQINLTETAIPGLNYSPVTSSGNGNRRISFTIPIVSIEPNVGNTAIIKAFDRLRNQVDGAGLSWIKMSKGGQFIPNPKVLYYWGTGSLPLVYYVSKCSFEHNSEFMTNRGLPEITNVSMELILDESNILYAAEQQFRYYASKIGIVQSVVGAFL